MKNIPLVVAAATVTPLQSVFNQQDPFIQTIVMTHSQRLAKLSSMRVVHEYPVFFQIEFTRV